MTSKPVPPEVLQMDADIKVLKDYLQAEWGDILSDGAFMMSGVMLWSEQMRGGMNPPHKIEVAYRRLQAITECGIEEMNGGVKQG